MPEENGPRMCYNYGYYYKNNISTKPKTNEKVVAFISDGNNKEDSLIFISKIIF
jgi:hypothetical protein